MHPHMATEYVSLDLGATANIIYGGAVDIDLIYYGVDAGMVMIRWSKIVGSALHLSVI